MSFRRNWTDWRTFPRNGKEPSLLLETSTPGRSTGVCQTCSQGEDRCLRLLHICHLAWSMSEKCPPLEDSAMQRPFQILRLRQICVDWKPSNSVDWKVSEEYTDSDHLYIVLSPHDKRTQGEKSLGGDENEMLANST